MSKPSFPDTRIDEILSGGKPLTNDERNYLITSLPSFEEGQHLTADSLSKMSDPELMQAAVYVWSEYCR